MANLLSNQLCRCVRGGLTMHNGESLFREVTASSSQDSNVQWLYVLHTDHEAQDTALVLGPHPITNSTWSEIKALNGKSAFHG